MVVFLDSVLYRNQSTPLKNINRLESLVHISNAFGYVFFPSSWSSCHPTCRVFWSCCCLQPFSKSSDIKSIYQEDMRESEIYENMWSHEDEILTIYSLWCRNNKLNAMWCRVVSVVFIRHCLFPIHCLNLWCHPWEISNKPYEMFSSN